MKPSKKQKKILLLAGTSIIVGAFLYLGAHVKTLSSKDNGTNKNLSQIQQQAKDAALSQGGTQKTSTTGQSSQPAASPPGMGGGSAPVAPTGEFVSSHTLSASVAVSSVCNTSVGATCQISFAKTDGTTKSLPAQVVNASGSTHWDWTAGDLLSTGTWSVKAVATRNGQDAISADAIQMVVQ